MKTIMNKFIVCLWFISSLIFPQDKNNSNSKNVKFNLSNLGITTSQITTADSSAKTLKASNYFSANNLKDTIYKIEIVKYPESNPRLEFIKIILATAFGGIIVWYFSYRT